MEISVFVLRSEILFFFRFTLHCEQEGGGNAVDAP